MTKYFFSGAEGGASLPTRYVDAMSVAPSVAIYLDLETMINGAKPTLAFGILVILAFCLILFFHACLWLNKISAFARDLILPTIGFLLFLLSMTIICWVTMSHWAAQHITADSFPGAEPIPKYGWSFKSIVWAFFLVLIDVVLLSFHFNQMQGFRAAHGAVVKTGLARTRGIGAGVDNNSGDGLDEHSNSTAYTPSAGFRDTMEDEADTRLFD